MSINKTTIINSAHQVHKEKKAARLFAKIFGGAKLMPIPSPKPSYPGELDHIDVSLLSRLIIEPGFIYSFETHGVTKINYRMHAAIEEDGVIALEAVFDNGEIVTTSIPTEQFESMLSKIMHSERSTRIEESELMKTAMASIQNDFIRAMKDSNFLYLALNETDKRENGIGIIRDCKSNQDVGTFESLSMLVNSSKQETYILNDIILLGRTDKELQDMSRFSYHFYDLGTNKVYDFFPRRFGHKGEGEITDITLEFVNAQIVLSDIDHGDPKLELIKAAQEEKRTFKSNKQDPLFDEEFQRFREPRVALLEKSKEDSKKKSMMGKFADIELF